MNYIKEINAFRNYLRTNPIPAITQALWYVIIDYHNSSNWEPWITIDNFRLMADLQISKNTLNTHRNTLVQSGLLLYKSIPRKKNSGRYCLVSLVEKQQTGIQTGANIRPDDEPDIQKNKTGANIEPECEPDGEPDRVPDGEPDHEPDVSGEPPCEPVPERHKLNKTKLNNNIVVVEEKNKEKENWFIVLKYFCQKSGRADTNLRNREREAAQEICEEVPSLDTVLKGIDYAFDNFKPDDEDDKINSFCYCAKVIKGLQKRENSKKNGGGKRGSSKQDTDSGENSSPYDFSRFKG